MKSIDLRHKFFSFFNTHGHTTVASSSLVPAQDPTLLFTNAGMNQFKDVFLGTEKRSYTRAVSIQKCMRAGGKHNDLDNVGFTSRHLTFFEMMGNFSFGDYFKKEAIRFAWDFLTQEIGLDANKLYATVFERDDEAYDIWFTQINVPKERISRLGAKDNFWQMGDVGPCGPCTEIYVDRGVAFGCGNESCAPGCACDRFMEIWNLVFMQFNRQPDGTDLPLAQTGVDTGMGLERLCVVMQQKNSVFETDLFAPILQAIEKITGIQYAHADTQTQAACNVLADHVRATTFLITDGITPANDGRGYVLRKIIRRAALFAQKLNAPDILPNLVEAVAQCMSAVYPELTVNQKAVKHILLAEVQKFSTSLVQGQQMVQEYMRTASNKTVTGAQAFKLYDTYGFPLELTQLIAQEQGFTVDTTSFEEHMYQQRLQSGSKMGKAAATVELPEAISTEFTGFEQLETRTVISALIVGNTLVQELPAGVEGLVITKQSPFYVEKGGQVSDEGTLTLGHIQTPILGLERINQAIAVKIVTPIALTVGQEVVCTVNKQFRLDVMNNHTATHLLQAALIALLGKEVKQSGSLVHPDYLRFDFTYHAPLTASQIHAVEELVNSKIRENIPLSIFTTTYKKAVEHGVIAIFGEKYNPENVRVIDVPQFSKELCGGTHVRATGDIGAFKIVEEIALSTGQRRIVAVTGRGADALFGQTFTLAKKLSHEFKAPFADIIPALEKQKEQIKQLQTTIKKLKKENWHFQLPSWQTSMQRIAHIPCNVLAIADASGDELREIVQLLQHNVPGLYFVYNINAHNQLNFIASLHDSVGHAEIITSLAAALTKQGIRSGGKKGTLQGGGPALAHDAIVALVTSTIQER
ncbi:MAG: alanine--tRNA ligase [Candidatus Babeliales bacterium]